MQNNKITRSQIPNKSNVKRWSQGEKPITQKDLKNMRVKIKNNNNQRANKNFNWRIKLNWKIALTKGKTRESN
jgi:hypothetical protein